jgi:hypothetical protein
LALNPNIAMLSIYGDEKEGADQAWIIEKLLNVDAFTGRRY